MGALSESYSNFISPINTGVSSARSGQGDRINISFTKGKKSNDETLKELSIAKALKELEQLNQVPATAEKQRFDWEAQQQQWAAEDQAMQSAANERAAKSAEQDAILSGLQAQALAADNATSGIKKQTLQAQLSAQNLENTIKNRAYNEALAAEKRDKSLRSQSLAYDILAGNPDTGKPWATYTPEHMRRAIQIMDSATMPQYAASNAADLMRRGYDPISAYTNSFVDTGRGQNYSLQPWETQQAQANAYRNTITSAASGYPNLNDAYARFITNSYVRQENPQLKVTSAYKYMPGRGFVYSPTPGKGWA